MTHPNREELAGRRGRDAAYWRKAYEDLVDQTGRDLNDGLGRDPRREGRYATSGRAAAAPATPEGLREAVTVIRDLLADEADGDPVQRAKDFLAALSPETDQ